MAITLGNVTFDEAQTRMVERYEEVGGRDERCIELKGQVRGESSAADIEARMDAILDAASADDYSALLSLRPGRCLYVRRMEFSREVSPEALVGSFVLVLGAQDPFETSETETVENWAVSASGATKAVSSAGNVYARPVITLVASGDVVNPSFSDGTRTIAYAGVVGDGETLVLDGESKTATLEDVDVMPYVSGVFPRVPPEGTTLTYEDGETSSHSASVTVTFKDRWW